MRNTVDVSACECVCECVFIRRLTTFAFNIFSSVRVKSSRSHSAGGSAGDAGAVGDATVPAAATGVCNRLTDDGDDGVAIRLLTTITTPPTATSMGVTIDLRAKWLTPAATIGCW